MAKDNIFLGIDFGTTKTSFAFVSPDSTDCQIFRDENGENDDKFYTFVCCHNKEWLFGNRVRNNYPPNADFIDDIKMDIANREIVYRDFRKAELASVFLSYLRKKFISQEPRIISNLTITVPAKWTLEQKQATLYAVKLAGFDDCKISILQEPLAAFLRFYSQDENKFKKYKKILVFDFGGGTCDLSLIKFFKGKPHVVASETINIAGQHIDLAICDHWMEKYNPRMSFKQLDGKVQKELKFEAEKSKVTVSNRIETESSFGGNVLDIESELLYPLDNGESINLNLSAGELRKVVRSVFGVEVSEENAIRVVPDKLAYLILKFLKDKDKDKDNLLDCLILSGGSCRTWWVRDLISRLVKDINSSVQIFPLGVAESIDQSVVRGAALYQSYFNKKDKVAIPSLNYKTRVSINFDGQKHSIEFDEGTVLPVKLRKTLTRFHWDIHPFARGKILEVCVEEFRDNGYKIVCNKPYSPKKLSILGELAWFCSINEFGLVVIHLFGVDLAHFKNFGHINLDPVAEEFDSTNLSRLHNIRTKLGI